MSRSLILLLASLFLSQTASDAVDPPPAYPAPPSCPDQCSRKSIACEVEESKLKFARLESIFDEKIREINARTQYFSDCEREIKELTLESDRLKSALSDSEEDRSRENVKLIALEEEVRLLWAASRKNNFEIYALEQKALDAERRLKEVASQVEETSQIVSEQWIQIQNLEQALYTVKVRTSTIRKELWKRCPFVMYFMNLYGDFLKILMEILGPYVLRAGPTFAILKSQAFQTFAAVKHYHHQLRLTPRSSPNKRLEYALRLLQHRQLQGFVRHAIKSNGLVASLAHEEVIFFVASALIAFPIMTACMLLLSQFS